MRTWVLAGMVLLLGCHAWAAEGKSKSSIQAEEKERIEMRKRVAEKKTDLNGTRWEVTLRSTDPKAKDQQDKFIFQDGQFRSENLSKRGFPSTNYTITTAEDGSESAVWETMQTAQEGVVFVRGEWVKASMQGNISEQLDGGKKIKNYFFTTSSRVKIPATSAEEEEGAKKGEIQEPIGGTGLKALVSKEARSKTPAAPSKT